MLRRQRGGLAGAEVRWERVRGMEDIASSVAWGRLLLALLTVLADEEAPPFSAPLLRTLRLGRRLRRPSPPSFRQT